MNAPLLKSGPRILIAGIGNIFLGDDAFGCEVAQRLLRLFHPDGVRVVDFGIRGLDLMYALSDGCDVAILIDAVPRGDAPGTLFLLEPQLDADDLAEASSPMLEFHSMDPLKVLRAVAAMGALPGQIFIVGCEPSPLAEDDMQMEMTAPVLAAVEHAVEVVLQIIERVRGESSNTIAEVSASQSIMNS